MKQLAEDLELWDLGLVEDVKQGAGEKSARAGGGRTSQRVNNMSRRAPVARTSHEGGTRRGGRDLHGAHWGCRANSTDHAKYKPIENEKGARTTGTRRGRPKGNARRPRRTQPRGKPKHMNETVHTITRSAGGAYRVGSRSVNVTLVTLVSHASPQVHGRRTGRHGQDSLS